MQLFAKGKTAGSGKIFRFVLPASENRDSRRPICPGFSSAATGNFSAFGVVPFLEKFAEKLFPRFDRFSGMFFLHMFHIGLIARHADEQTDELFPVAPGIF
jgi:hypothetical protein